jgi:hypothetical protein
VVSGELEDLDFWLPGNVLAREELERILVVLFRSVILRIVEFRVF